MGKRDNYNGKPYSGGSIFKTYQDADNYLTKNNLKTYSVFGVLANWDNDTEPNINKEYNNLLTDSQLVLI
jgi:hypothetical protein